MKFLYGSDFHFRHSTPKCRTDNYAETVVNKMKWLKKMTRKYKIPLLSGGDLFDKDLYKSPVDVVLTLKIIAEHLVKMIGIIGNHDLVHRSMEYLDQSTISVPIKSGQLTHIDGYYDLDDSTRVFGFDYGTGGIKHPDPEDLIEGTNIAMLHEYVSKKPNPLFGKYVGIDLLKEFPEFAIILTGDNHVTFTEEYEGRFLINPGSLLRMDADQIDHKPCIFIVDTDEMSFEPIYVPIEEGVVSREHLDIQRDREERMLSFVDTMEQDYELTDSFKKNMERYLGENKYDKETKEEQINMNIEKFVNMAIEGDLKTYG